MSTVVLDKVRTDPATQARILHDIPPGVRPRIHAGVTVSHLLFIESGVPVTLTVLHEDKWAAVAVRDQFVEGAWDDSLQLLIPGGRDVPFFHVEDGHLVPLRESELGEHLWPEDHPAAAPPQAESPVAELARLPIPAPLSDVQVAPPDAEGAPPVSLGRRHWRAVHPLAS